MKTHIRIIVLLVVVVALTLLFALFRQAASPESAIIARERNKLAASEKDAPTPALQEKLRFLDYRMAVAYNTEDQPDKAIAVLQKLISDEQSLSKSGSPRRSSSYENEARYYEALQESYRLKKDDAGVERAAQLSAEVLARAEAARKNERLSEGRSVGLKGE